MTDPLRDALVALEQRMRKRGVVHGVRQFTGNDHLLFANEIATLLSSTPPPPADVDAQPMSCNVQTQRMGCNADVGALVEVAPSIEAAEAMGAKGGPADEGERAAFEAWMRGHAWALCATWDGSSYRSDAEQGGGFCPKAAMTRRLWAAWRARAALHAIGLPGMVARADAWRDFALHQVVCGECAHSVSDCHVGSELQAAAIALEASRG